MNALTTQENSAVMIAMAPLTRDELIDTLIGSCYPGAKRESVALVLNYCVAAKLDPIQKPVHLVPMTVKSGEVDNWGNEKKEKRDVIMPGIGLYRIQASRGGVYAGQDRPVYGPMVELTYQKKITEWVEVPGRDKRQPRHHYEEATLLYPEWCEITVYKLVGGMRVAFTAQEYWLENYATAGPDTDAPNEMWSRRTRAQLKKCAEAQALRMAFPDAVGAQPTAEEMEGRAMDLQYEDPAVDRTAASLTPQSKSATTQATAATQSVEDVTFTETKTAAPPPPAAPPKPAAAGTINEGQTKYLRQKLAAVGLEGDAITKFIVKHGAQALDTTITLEQFDAMKAELLAAL